MSYTEEDLTITIDRLLNNGNPEDYPPPLLFMAQYYLYKKGRMDLVKKIGDVARKRLIDSGLIRCLYYGWFTRKQISEFGLVYKNGWKMENVWAFKNWCEKRFKEYNSSPVQETMDINGT